MNNIVDYGLREAYKSMKSMDKLAEIDPMINWESLRHIAKELNRNDTDKGCRPNIDEIVMIKTLFLQSMYNYSDESIERERYNRIDFRNFLHYPEIIPDSRSICVYYDLNHQNFFTLFPELLFRGEYTCTIHQNTCFHA